MIVLLEKLKEGCAFAVIKAPAFLDNESRNAETKIIDVGYLSSLGDPSPRTIQRFICSSSGIRDAAYSKITL